MVDFQVFPERTALINVDMQNVFVEGDWPAARMDWRSSNESTASPRCVARLGSWSSTPATCFGPTARIWGCWVRWRRLCETA